MSKTNSKFHSLSRRIVLQFCGFTLILSALYSLISFTLMYTLEDGFIVQDILREARYLTTEYEQTSEWPAPRKDNMQLHFSKDTFPEDMRDIAKQEPRRKEFYGQQGRHYHLHAIEDYQNTYLLAEVSADLLVRPIRAQVIRFLSISGVILTIIACLIAWLISRKTIRPLHQLAELADGVEPGSVPNQFSDQFPNNEIGRLARNLEQSWQRIADALAREKHFTRDVSHELRTPLAVIKSAAELHQTDSSASDSGKAAMRSIADASEQMEKTVHTLLVLAREENTGASKEPVELMPVIERSVLDQRALLDGKAVDINISDHCRTTVVAQQGMLKVLLDNLLGNAFQYVSSGEVSIDYQDSTLVVSDTGPGIEPAIASQVTEPNIKGSQSKGYGFGLSIVKRLCEHQGWQLDVASDKGTTISVRLGS